MTPKMNLFLSFIGIFCILTAGCLAPQAIPQTSPTPPPTTQSTPLPTTELPTPSPVNTPSIQFTRDEVYELFIDIAFGCDNTWVTMFSPSSENHLFISLEGEVNSSDIDFATRFAEEFNRIAPIEVFSEEPLNSRGSPIIFYPENSLNSLEKRFIACQETDPVTGEPLSIIYKTVTELPNGDEETTTKIYLNANLAGVERNHYLQKAMLYYLGFPGQTYNYPESVFYYDSRSTVDFTQLDIEAMKTLYHPGIYPGMSVQEVRWLLFND